jgi:hypothetical protein
MYMESSVDAAKTPFGLSLSKGERGFCGVTHGGAFVKAVRASTSSQETAIYPLFFNHL